MKRICFLMIVAAIFSACGTSSKTTSSFKVRMHGIYSPPPGASGTTSPRSQTYLFNGVVLTKSDATEIPLYTGDPQSFKIIDRGQLIFSETDMSEYDDTVITSVKVQMDPTVVVTSKNGVDSTITLASGDLELVETYTVTKSKEQVLTIKIAWGDTITINDDGTETITAPTFTLKYEDAD